MGPMRLYMLVCLFVCPDQVLPQTALCPNLPYKKPGGSFTRSKVGLSRRPTTVHRGLGQPAPTAGSGAPPQYVCRIYFKQYSEL